MIARTRVTAILVTFAGGAGLLMPGTAGAADPSVTFTGGCGKLGIAAWSEPDTSTLDMTTGSTVRLINQLGQAATLLVDGDDLGEVPPDQEARLTITETASTTVQMQPECLLKTEYDGGALTINILSAAGPSASATPTPGVAPTPPVQTSGPAQADPVPATGSPSPGPADGNHRRTHRPSTRPAAGGANTIWAGTVPFADERTPGVQIVDPPDAAAGPVASDLALRHSLSLVGLVIGIGGVLAVLRLVPGPHPAGVHRFRRS